MAKYTVLKPYTDKQNGGPLKVGDVVEYDDERAKFVEETLEAFGGGFLEKVKASRKTAKKELKEEHDTFKSLNGGIQ